MTEYSDDTGASKTRLKQDMTALVEQAHRLMALKPTDRARLPLTDGLRKGLEEGDRIRHADARRRHAHHLAKQLQDEAGERVLAALQQLEDPARRRRLDLWLEQFTAADRAQADDTIDAVMRFYPHGDRQHLRNLVRNLLRRRPEDGSQDPAFKRERRKLSDYLNELEKQAPLY